MYLRTTKRRNKDGSIVKYYQLAHNNRHPETRKPVARIIHSFGRADRLDRDDLVRLCRSIGRVCGLEINDPLIDSTGSGTGVLENFTIKETLSFGSPMVIESLWESLGLKKILTDIAGSKELRVPYERALLAMTANRLCEPESKSGVWDRWLSRVYLPSCSELKLKHMYEAMDHLHEHAKEVEEAIFYKIADLFNLEADLILYDTTTASFYTDREDNPVRGEDAALRKSGYAHRFSQVIVALAVTREGIPVRSWVFPGNTSYAGSLERIKSDLRGWRLGRAMFVSDEDAACGYKGLMVIERCFRALRRMQIKMVYHWTVRRIESHVKICVLALLIERIAELKCGRPWPQIKRILDGLQITKFFSLNYSVLMRNELDNKVCNILKLLDITPPKKVINLQKIFEKRS